MYFCKNPFILLSAMINKSIPHSIFRIQIIAVKNISMKIFKRKLLVYQSPPKISFYQISPFEDDAELSSYFLPS